MSDQHDEKAEALLPCEYVVEHDKRECLPADKAICAPCKARPALAAAMRAQGQRNAELEQMINDSDVTMMDYAVKQQEQAAEIERLRAEPKCAWCTPVGSGIVPCPFHGGGEHAYELTENKEALVERQRAELLSAQLAAAEAKLRDAREAIETAIEEHGCEQPDKCVACFALTQWLAAHGEGEEG